MFCKSKDLILFLIFKKYTSLILDNTIVILLYYIENNIFQLTQLHYSIETLANTSPLVKEPPKPPQKE